MKILFYSMRADEVAPFNEWTKNHPDVQVDQTDKLFTEETAKLAAGYDGVVLFQQETYSDAAINILNDLGVKNLSFRNVGVDNINLELVESNGMKLTNVPVYSPNAIAEHASFLMGRLLRRVPEYDKKIARKDLRWAPEIGREIRNQTIGIIGTGHIGQVLIKIMQGYGAKVVCYDIFRNKELEEAGMYVDSLDELYKVSDIITLHVPAVKDNVHMINKDSIAKMKDGVIIINVSRGTLVNTDDLLAGLDNKKIGGAGLDVYEDEVGIFNETWEGKEFPDARLNDLMSRDNVIVTPHIAFYTDEAVHNMVTVSLDSNVKLIQGENPNTLVK
ncbi:lactate dehydrogenase [Companilactobacillus sp. RD055328]|uniref:D-2-hydroxyacid dehydrogenase n=1 Tax=Companilactobacillus sp. RD055328 TaxID=2916634 RepID=UPI001FC86DC3|nr:D-2-hydroxyacid dehydrogenase [Companilactobacillus sp. RD055328]GKQ43312.1 lactate dehydrogenase [Companilactobacillus sp. RD055328]